MRDKIVERIPIGAGRTVTVAYDPVPDVEKCPGCNLAFEKALAVDDLTALLPWPFGDPNKKQRWHLRCHQDSYFHDLRRDRRTEAQRIIDEMHDALGKRSRDDR